MLCAECPRRCYPIIKLKGSTWPGNHKVTHAPLVLFLCVGPDSLSCPHQTSPLDPEVRREGWNGGKGGERERGVEGGERGVEGGERGERNVEGHS